MIREARAREDLESWLEVLREAEQCAQDARQRLDRARIAREEVVGVLAEEGAVVRGPDADVASSAAARTRETDVPVPVGGLPPAATGPVLREGYDPRPPIWQAGMGAGALAGTYRQLFEAVVAAPGPVCAQELTLALGRDATRLNEVEKVRHRAYALQARGWLLREGGVSTPAAGPAARGGTRASADAGGPSAASG